MPSQYYVDLFYSQLAYSYYGSLHFHWRENFCRIMSGKGPSDQNGESLNMTFHDPLSHMADMGVTGLVDIYSDNSRDFGPQMQLTGSVFYRGDLGQILLAQAYDGSIENPMAYDVTTEFSLIAEYDSQNKTFSYPGEKRYSINPWERYHISILMKAIFVFMFFDVSKEFYIVLISLYLLYVKGLFDGIQDLFERISSNHPMDATLAELRRRRAEIELEAQTRLEREQEPLTGPDPCPDADLDKPSSQEEDKNTSESSLLHLTQPNESSEDRSQQLATPDEEFEDGSLVILACEEAHFLDPLGVLGPNEILNAPQVDDIHGSNGGLNHEKTTETRDNNTSEASQRSQTQDVSYLACIIYQTIGMYIFTLMPWWNPDPTYLV